MVRGAKGEGHNHCPSHAASERRRFSKRCAVTGRTACPSRSSCEPHSKHGAMLKTSAGFRLEGKLDGSITLEI